MLVVFICIYLNKRLLYNQTCIYYFRVGLEVFASFMIVVTIQVSCPVIKCYKSGELGLKFVILYVFAVILGLIVFTSHHFFAGQSIYLPVNFFAVWDTWNLYIKYVPPSLIPLCLLINDTKIRNFVYFVFVVLLTAFNLFLDMRLPFVSRISTIAYLIISLCVLDLSLVVYVTLCFDLSFGNMLLIYIPTAILLSMKAVSFYNYASKRYINYLTPLAGDKLDPETGIPLRFLDDPSIIDGLRYLASNDGEGATSLALFLMVNTHNKRIRIEAIRILIILNQKSDIVARYVVKMKPSDVPWYMKQCLIDSQFEAISYFSKTVCFDSVLNKYEEYEGNVKQSIITVIDQILNEDYEGCYEKMLEYTEACDDLEYFIKRAITVMTFSPSFYERISQYYELLRGDIIMADISRYKSLIIQEENKKVKSIKTMNQQEDMIHFVSYRSRITSMAPVNIKQNAKQKIQEMANSVESATIKKSKFYFKILFYIFLSFLIYSFFAVIMTRKKQMHLLVFHKILTSRIIPIYRLSVAMAEIINKRENITLVYNSTHFCHENLRYLTGDVTAYFCDLEDIHMLSKRHIHRYTQMALYEKKYQNYMHIIIKMIENGIRYEEIDYLYNTIRDLDQVVESYITMFAEIRESMDKVYYQICFWIPLINILSAVLILILIHRELEMKYFTDINKLWEILMSKDVSKLENFYQMLVYKDVDDFLLEDEEIEVNNYSKIEVFDRKMTKRKRNVFINFTCLSILFDLLALIVYQVYLRKIVGIDFPKNTSLFFANRVYQRLFIVAADSMMYILRKNETNSLDNLKQNIEIAKKTNNSAILNSEYESIKLYLGIFDKWIDNGMKVDDNFVCGVNTAFLKSKTKILTNLHESSEKIGGGIRFIQSIDHYLCIACITIFFTYSILFYLVREKKSKCFASYKAIIQILPYQHITPQLHILMSFTNTKQKESASTQNKAILRSFPDAMMIVSSDNVVQSINKSMESLAKASKQSFINHNVNEYIQNYEFFISHNTSNNIMHFNTNLFRVEQIPISVTAIFLEEKNFIIIKDRRSEIDNSDRLRQTKMRVENLLSRMLPRQMKIKIMGKQKLYSQIERSTIIFIGISDFLGWCKIHNHIEIMELLDVIFTGFDEKIELFPSLTKLKTINGTYMVASGLFDQNKDQEAEALDFCLECVKSVQERKRKKKVFEIELNIGINTGGPIITGILGDELPVFDIWGDAVNVASRLETSCPANFIQLSKETKDSLQPGKYNFIETKVFLKGKGETIAYRLPI